MYISPNLKKIILSLLVIFISLTIFTTPLLADDTNPAEVMLQEYCNRRDSSVVNLEQWYGGKCHGTPQEQIGFSNIILLDAYQKLTGSPQDSSLIKGIFEKLQGLTTGKTSMSEVESLLTSADNNQNDTGVIGTMAKLMGKIYSIQPASSIEYLSYIRNNIAQKHLITPVYADANNGYGFTSLQALLPIWRIFRNVSYFLFTLVFVFIGFMMMFRMKISPQAVISIQTALPKIILTLILITFSYAIAGLLIDLSYVVTGFIFSVLSTGSDAVIGFTNNAAFLSGQTIGLGGPIVAMLIHLISFGLTAKILAVFLPPFFATVFSIPGNLVIGLILLIAVLITFAKIIWMLLKSSVTISLQVMFAPFILLGGIFPGSSAGGNWIKGLAAELAVFVTTMVCFVFVFYFIGPVTFAGINPGNIDVGGQKMAGLFEVGRLATDKNFWMGPPLYGQGTDSAGKFALLGLGIFFLIPKLADMMHDVFKAPAFKYGNAINEALAPAARNAPDWGKAAYTGRFPGAGAINDVLGFIGKAAGRKS